MQQPVPTIRLIKSYLSHSSQPEAMSSLYAKKYSIGIYCGHSPTENVVACTVHRLRSQPCKCACGAEADFCKARCTAMAKQEKTCDGYYALVV